MEQHGGPGPGWIVYVPDSDIPGRQGIQDEVTKKTVATVSPAGQNAFVVNRP